jgi:hypothetical protein
VAQASLPAFPRHNIAGTEAGATPVRYPEEKTTFIVAVTQHAQAAR